MRRVDIVGLTLAELSLAILFAFLILVLPSRARVVAKNHQIAAELSQVRATLEKAQSDVQRLAARLALHEALQRGKSKATPSCAETGFANQWLFTTTVKG